MALLAPMAIASNLTYQFDLPADRVHVATEDGFTTIRVDDRAFALTSDPGLPVLPFRIVGVLLPQGEDVASAYADADAERALTPSAMLERARAMLSEEGASRRRRAPHHRLRRGLRHRRRVPVDARSPVVDRHAARLHHRHLCPLSTARQR